METEDIEAVDNFQSDGLDGNVLDLLVFELQNRRGSKTKRGGSDKKINRFLILN